MTLWNDKGDPKIGNDGSLTEQVYSELLKRFLKNEITPGTVLNRKEIAEELKVSMAPVREALMRLTMEGFVDTLPRKGTIAKAITRDDVYGSIILREAIECQAARMYCGKTIQDKLESLVEYAREADRSYDDLDLVKHWRLDLGFHQKLIQLTACKTMEDQFKQVMRVGTFYQINNYLSNDDRQEKLSHIELIQKLSTEDPDEAEKIIRDHLKSGKRKFYNTSGGTL